MIGSPCLCVVQIKAKDMLGGKRDWDNFAQVIYTFHVHYCFAEGLTETSEMTRQVLLYLFYGSWMSPKNKPSAIIRYLHKKIISGRHRFGKYVKKHFARFLKENSKEENKSWSSYFKDAGKGETPLDYLIEIEKGLRSFADDLHAMGTGTLRLAI